MKQLSALLLTLVVITPNAPLLAVKSGTSRSVGNPTSGTGPVEFAGAQFVPDVITPALYMNSVKDYTLVPDQALYQIAKANLDTTGALVMTPLAQAKAALNVDLAGLNAVDSPFNLATGVTGIAVPPKGNFIAAFNNDTADDATKAVYAVDVASAGATVSTSGQLNAVDARAAGGARRAIPQQQVYAVAAANDVLLDDTAGLRKDLIFAATSLKPWDQVDTDDNVSRGIAIIAPVLAPGTPGETQIAPLDPANIHTLAAAVKTAAPANNASLPLPMDPAAYNFADWAKSLGVAGAGTPMGSTKPVAAVDMHWSDRFKRLYVGVDMVAGGANAAHTGGLVGVGSVLVTPEGAGIHASAAKGSNVPADHTAVFQSIVASNPTVTAKAAGAVVAFNTLFPDDDVNHVVAVGHNGGDADISVMEVNIKKIRSMVTSTNKDYLIVNSHVVTAGGAHQAKTLAALPLVAGDGRLAAVDAATGVAVVDNAGLTAADALFGKFNKFPDLANQVVDSQTAVIKNPVRVAPNLSDAQLDKISDLYIDGDTVYISLNDAHNGHPTIRGLFRSTALFNADGAIVGWTPAERVGGDLGVVQGAGYDAATGNVYALTSDKYANNVNGQPINTVKVSHWGKADANPAAMAAAANPENNLGTVLSGAYPAADAGIHSIAAFNECTAGFSNAGNASIAQNNAALSLMAVVGKDQVSLLEAGKSAGLGGGNDFLPTPDFTVAPANKKVFTYGATAATTPDESIAAPVLDTIAPLSCVELSRTAQTGTGYMFIGGYNGLAVASNAGTGYDGTVGVATLAAVYGGLPDTCQLVPTNANNSFTDIRKLVGVEDVMFVMTATKLYGFKVSADGGRAVTANRFNAAPPALPGTALNEHVVTLGLPDNTVLYDMVAVPVAGGTFYNLILATSAGVYHAQVDIGGNGGDAFTPATVANVAVADLTRVIANGETEAPGYALQMNYLSIGRGQPLSPGNLFVLYADPNNLGAGQVRRYAVDTAHAGGAAHRVKLVSNDVAKANEVIPNVNTFELSNILGGFAVDGNTIFQARSYDLNYNRGASVSGLVMNSALDTPGVPVAKSISDEATAAINELFESGVKFAGAPAIDPATGFVMIPNAGGIISNQ